MMHGWNSSMFSLETNFSGCYCWSYIWRFGYSILSPWWNLNARQMWSLLRQRSAKYHFCLVFVALKLHAWENELFLACLWFVYNVTYLMVYFVRGLAPEREVWPIATSQIFFLMVYLNAAYLTLMTTWQWISQLYHKKKDLSWLGQIVLSLDCLVLWVLLRLECAAKSHVNGVLGKE